MRYISIQNVSARTHLETQRTHLEAQRMRLEVFLAIKLFIRDNGRGGVIFISLHPMTKFQLKTKSIYCGDNLKMLKEISQLDKEGEIEVA